MSEVNETTELEGNSNTLKENPPVKRPRGRPKKDPNAPPTKRPPGRPRKKPIKKVKEQKLSISELIQKVNVEEVPPLYKCTKCGLVTSSPDGKFYLVPNLEVFNGNGHYSYLCSNCTRQYFEDFKNRFESEKVALLMTCAITGHYFSEKLYAQMISKGDSFNLGHYFRYMNMAQYKGKSFYTFLLELQSQRRLFAADGEIQEFQESKWKIGDKRNKLFATQTVGYDCFDEDIYNDEDRKFLYNTLAGYLTEEVSEDPHKMNCAIGLVKNLWQVDKITKIINTMITSAQPDTAAIQKLMATKTSLQSIINTTAKANGISAEGSGKKTGSGNSLTFIMKSMLNDGFDDAKANVTDTLLCEAYRDIAQTNAKALMNELNFSADEYAKMVAEQSEMVAKQSEEIVEKAEEIRLLKVKIAQMEKSAKYKKAKPVDLVESEDSGDVQ